MKRCEKLSYYFLLIFCTQAWAKQTVNIDDIEQKLSALQNMTTNTPQAFATFGHLADQSLQTVAVARITDETTPLSDDVIQTINQDLDENLDKVFDTLIDDWSGVPHDKPTDQTNDVEQVVDTPTSVVKKSRPNVVKRLYNRLFNDGVENQQRLNASIYIQTAVLDKDGKTVGGSVSLSDEAILNTPTQHLVNSSWAYEADMTDFLKNSQFVRQKADVSAEPFKNIKASLDNIATDSASDMNIAMPRLRQAVNDAAHAVGYYELDFRLEDKGAGKIDVIIQKLGEPVKIDTSLIDVRGIDDLTQFNQTPKDTLKISDIFHHGEYETAKADIGRLSSDYGFFDGRWLDNSVDVILPDNTADVSLIYDAGERYVFDDVVFFTVDEQGNFTTDTDKLPVKPELLTKLLTFKKGDNYENKRINALANNLTATRYFDNTNVEVIYPQLPNDVSAQETDTAQPNADQPNANEVLDQINQTVVLDSQTIATVSPIDFSPSQDVLAKLQKVQDKAQKMLDLPKNQLLGQTTQNKSLLGKLSSAISKTAKLILPDESDDVVVGASPLQFANKKSAQAVYEDKKVPLYVFVASEKPRQAQVGIGYGTDTGVHATAKFEHNLINKDGYQAGVDLAYSGIERTATAYVSRPLSHPINDKLSANLQYKEEAINQGVGNFELSSRTLKAGLSRTKIWDNDWHATYGLRYRLDELDSHSDRTTWQDLPVKFIDGKPIQKALLAGITLNRYVGDTLNPLRGYQQNYSLQVGSKSALSDANMAILRAGVGGVYSFGNNLYGKDRKHQLVGRLDLGYLWSDNFDNVPYKMRFFTGGDQTIRGYDYESLSPVNRFGYLTGGQSLAVGSFEYNYEIKEGLRTAVFADVGNAYDKKFSGDTKIGAGVGIRYASPVGTVRVDLATPIGEDKARIKLHFLIGVPF